MKAKALKAACLAVGLATAWGGQADAGGVELDQIQLTITPNNNLSHVYFLYRANGSPIPYTIKSLPDLVGGTSTTETFSVSSIVSWGAEAFYSVIGLYDEANKLVTIGCNSNAAASLIGNTDFNTAFYDSFYFPFTEDAFAAALLSNDTSTIAWFLWQNPPLTPINESCRLVNFSNASDGGSVSATIIPEPSPILLVGFGALLLFVFHRKPRHPLFFILNSSF